MLRHLTMLNSAGEIYKFDRNVVGKQIELPLYFRVQELAFHAMGINIKSYDFHYGLFWKTWLPGLLTFLLNVGMVHSAWINSHDVKRATESLSPLFQFVLIFWKISIILFNRKSLVNIVQRIEKMSLNVSNEERKILVEENRKDIGFAGVFYASVIATGVTSMCAPLIKTLLVYLKSDSWQYYTIFKSSFVVDYSVFRYFIVTYIWCIAAVYFGGSGAVLAESLYSWYIHNIAAQFRMLQTKLEKLINDPKEKYIISWLKNHEECIQLAREFKDIFAPILFVQFTLNSAQICLIAFQINDGVSLAELPFHMAFLSAVLVQLTIYCYGGEHIQNESDAVSYAIYSNCNWLTWPVRILKMMQLAIMRAQKSSKLTGIFFEVNFRLYLWVVRTAASYITMLYSLN